MSGHFSFPSILPLEKIRTAEWEWEWKKIVSS